MTTAARVIRTIDLRPAEFGSAASAIDDLYNDTLDVIVARGNSTGRPAEN